MGIHIYTVGYVYTVGNIIYTVGTEVIHRGGTDTPWMCCIYRGCIPWMTSVIPWVIYRGRYTVDNNVIPWGYALGNKLYTVGYTGKQCSPRYIGLYSTDDIYRGCEKYMLWVTMYIPWV